MSFPFPLTEFLNRWLNPLIVGCIILAGLMVFTPIAKLLMLVLAVTFVSLLIVDFYYFKKTGVLYSDRFHKEDSPFDVYQSFDPEDYT